MLAKMKMDTEKMITPKKWHCEIGAQHFASLVVHTIAFNASSNVYMQ